MCTYLNTIINTYTHILTYTHDYIRIRTLTPVNILIHTPTLVYTRQHSYTHANTRITRPHPNKHAHTRITRPHPCAGLFAESHMNFEIDRLRDPKNTQPTLVEMTEKAINVLKQAEDGFFLLVEGKRTMTTSAITIDG